MTEQNVRPSLADLYRTANPSILAFVNKMQVSPAGEPPLFPEIIGTGFFVNAEGIAITNRHVVDAIEKIPPHPQTGERMVGALSLLLDADRNGCEMLSVSIHSTSVLDTFSSSDHWYGQKVPDIGFVQLKVRGNQFLELATERFAIHPGMEISTIGYPMGTLPLTLHEKVNQISPFIRRGIISSVYPCPVAHPHGFTIDIVQQGGSSGSPIFGPDNRRVVGLMWGGVNEPRKVNALTPQPEISAALENSRLITLAPTNISLAESAHIVAKALEALPKQDPKAVASLPTIDDLRAAGGRPLTPTDFPWDVIPFDPK